MLLKNKGVIKSSNLLIFLIKITSNEKKIKSGYFLFPKNISYYDILNILVTGKEILIKVTVPEGYNIYQIAELLFKKKLINSPEVFENFCFDREKIKNFLNNGISMEGYLYPDTYLFPKSATLYEIVRFMNDNFRKKIINKLYNDIANSNLTLNQIVTLASIVQKETYNKKEMPLIASVFFNRLKLGMRLQSDPTVIYGIWKDYHGKLTKKDLTKYTPYNTYIIKGLPPTPICNPGYYAIYSVLHPAKTNFLYFVSTNKGYHVFAKTYKEHLKNVYIYQKSKK